MLLNIIIINVKATISQVKMRLLLKVLKQWNDLVLGNFR